MCGGAVLHSLFEVGHERPHQTVETVRTMTGGLMIEKLCREQCKCFDVCYYRCECCEENCSKLKAALEKVKL